MSKFHCSPVIHGLSIYLTFLCGDRRIPGDEFGEHPTQGLNTQRQGGNIQEKNILDISSQYTPLDCGSNSNCLIRVDSFAGLSAKRLLHNLLNLHKKTWQIHVLILPKKIMAGTSINAGAGWRTGVKEKDLTCLI